MALSKFLQADASFAAANIFCTVVLPFIEVLECAGLARVCTSLRKYAERATTGDFAGSAPQTLSVIFRTRVSCSADLKVLLHRFPFCTSLEMSQRQMPRYFEYENDEEYSDSDSPLHSDSETESDCENLGRALVHSCNVRRFRFHAFLRWLMDIETVRRNLQELHVVDVSWNDEDGLGYSWSGYQIDRRGSGRGEEDLRRLYVHSEIHAAAMPAWRESKGLLWNQGALRVLSFNSHARRFGAHDARALASICPALEVLFLSPFCTWKIDDTALRTIGAHCRSLRVLHIPTYGCPRISENGLLALPLGNIEGLYIGGVHLLQGGGAVLKALLESAPKLKQLSHCLSYSDDESIVDSPSEEHPTQTETSAAASDLGALLDVDTASFRAWGVRKHRQQWYWREVWHPEMMRRGVKVIYCNP